MHPEAVEGLLEERVLAEGGLPAEAPATVGPGEQARWQGNRVTKREGGIVRSRREELLPNALLDLPKVGALSGEGGAVDFVQGGEPLPVMLPEVVKDRLVGVHAEELSDDLDGDGLRVGKLGSRTALTNTAALEPVVDEAEDGNDEGKEPRKKASFTPFGLIATERREVFSLAQVLKETCTRG